MQAAQTQRENSDCADLALHWLSSHVPGVCVLAQLPWLTSLSSPSAGSCLYPTRKQCGIRNSLESTFRSSSGLVSNDLQTAWIWFMTLTIFKQPELPSESVQCNEIDLSLSRFGRYANNLSRFKIWAPKNNCPCHPTTLRKNLWSMNCCMMDRVFYQKREKGCPV